MSPTNVERVLMSMSGHSGLLLQDIQSVRIAQVIHDIQTNRPIHFHGKMRASDVFELENYYCNTRQKQQFNLNENDQLESQVLISKPRGTWLSVVYSGLLVLRGLIQ